MDKNNIIGAVLIAAVFIGYSVYSQPSKEEKAAAARQDSIENVARKNAENAAKLAAQQKVAQAQAAAEADTTALFHSALKGKATNVVLKNKSVELTLNTKGGVVSKAVIKNFTDYKGNQNVTLFDSNSQSLNFALAAKDVNINTSDLYFTPSNQTDSTVTMTATAGNGKELVINYVLGSDYMLHAQLQTVGMAGDFAPSVSQMDVQWKDMCRQQERGFTFENRYASLTYHKVDGGTDYLSEAKSITDENIEKKIDWVAFKNQFFSAVMIAKNNFAENSLMTSVPQEKGSGNLKQYEAKMKTFFDPSGKTPSEFDFYFGPNDFRLLKRVEAEVYIRQGPRDAAPRLPRMAALPHHQPLVYYLRLRLPHRSEHQHGYRAHPYHDASEVHHLSYGEEELHVVGKDACAEAETRRGYQAPQQA